MPPRRQSSQADQWGTVTVQRLASREISTRTDGRSPVMTEQDVYEWRPLPVLSPNLPKGYSVSLTALSARGKGRRFQPTDDTRALALFASLGGLAILNEVTKLDAEQRNTYNLMRLLFQHAPLVREALDRRFDRIQDLSVSRGQRDDVDDADVLPDTIGLDDSGRGRRWRVGGLIQAGQREAADREIQNPSEADLIRLGVVAAARLNPVDVTNLTTSDAARFLRVALFDLGPAEVRIDAATEQEVTGRLFEAIHPHLDDSVENFRRWFFDKRDGIGQILRPIVRQVVLEKVFESLQYTGQCVHVQMQVIANEIDPALDDDERSIFEATYCEQPWLGGLPLLVLRRYFGPIREAVQDLWLEPHNAQYQGVLLRVLQFQGEMIRKRREADRKAKKGDAKQRRVLHTDRPLTREEYSLQSQELDLRELAREVSRVLKLSCKCGTASDFQARFDLESSSQDAVEIDFICDQCGKAQRCKVSSAQIARIASLHGG
jgi:hypothetical protein